MSAKEITDLYENLSIAEEDGVVLETSETEIEDGAKDVDCCLVGKVLTGKKVNREAFRSLIEQIWSPFGQVEQIGEVVEIPADSRECWGKFMRVKVCIDISKSLRRWLRLKLGKTEEITTVSLKYERLPEFCYACGRVGHGILECLDVDARKQALECTPTKYGAWLKALTGEKLYYRNNSQGYESSSDRGRSTEGSREGEGDGSVSLRGGSLVSMKGSPVVTGAAQAPEKLGTLVSAGEVGLTQPDEMCVDGLGKGPSIQREDLGLQGKSRDKVPKPFSTSIAYDNLLPQAQFPSKYVKQTIQTQSSSAPSKPVPKDTDEAFPMSTIPPNKTRKWKRNAREGKTQVKPVITTSSFQRLLEISKSPVKISKSKSLSPSSSKKEGQSKQRKSPHNCKGPSSIFSPNHREGSSVQLVFDDHVCKRKMVFDPLDSESRELKKIKKETANPETIISAEPEVQACRKQ
ncbi:hypothetical protein EZV62_020080 [Acer yangbiense]|uniref:CCHC-type domain-containing protein n=1 Tax=Acer yangbiense TaxID=1000413 RepID=A0A5C7HCW1_9ROSI|nr:hypothetical protein EZV62_020080 [Acer yangbiense]